MREHEHEFRLVIGRHRGWEYVRGYRCACGEWKRPDLSLRANARAAAAVLRRRYGR